MSEVTAVPVSAPVPTRIATAIANGAVEAAAHSIAEQLRRGLAGASPALVLIFASTSQPLGALMARLSQEFAGAVVLSASTAGEFTERGDAKKSVSAFALAGDYRVFAGMGQGLKANPEKAIESAVNPLPKTVEGFPYRTAVLLIDALSGNGEEVTLLTSALLGPDARLAGGAAGDDLAMRSALVGMGAQVANDAAVVATIFSRAPLGVGVCHGHSPLSAPLRVTKAQGNVVHTVNNRPAWDVWREHTRSRAFQRGIHVENLAPEMETPYLLRYEAALTTPGGELKIRAPLSRNKDGSINFACGIPEGATIRITDTSAEKQVESAREAARRAREQLGGKQPAGALVFDCICRNLILGPDFGRAVKGISQEFGGAPIAGFETYGEIALDAGELSGFHNTTSVVLAFP